jgi:enoyl-CoA hydratase
VAMIQGACIGGGLEIAGVCDFRICGESARFGAPINRLGFSMYPGEMEGLLRLVGPAVLKEILLEGRILSATEAYAKGLVTRIVSDQQTEEEAYATARRICAGAPLVAGWHKQWIRRLLDDRPLSDEEKTASFAFLDTEDYKEGLSAFLEKRKPQFKAR